MTNIWFLDEESRSRWILYRVKKHVLEAETDFCTVRIMDTESLGRILVLDSKIQSAELDEHIYHEALVHPAMTAHSNPRRVLILGGGEGATLREVLKHGCVQQAIMVDINKQLVEICRKYLPAWHRNAFRDKRARIIFDDAADFIREAREKFDVIISDISDPEEGSPAAFFYTKEFFTLVKGRLKPDGIFVSQATEIFYDGSGIHPIINRTAARVFRVAESFCEFIPSFSSMWGFIAGTQGLSLKGLERKSVTGRLKERGVKTDFYSAAMHARMFILPPAAQKAITGEKKISTRKNPATVYSGSRGL